ncbi:hypothetical protein BKA83DRAFT_4463704 [Pisolithus microcarpus]|nr:hypothetical protein BKA83DRAFT_4463704 [Pisolithus microcarpus]
MQPVTHQDEYYRHEHATPYNASLLCSRFITHLFACPDLPPSSLGSMAKLQKFIAYALHCMKLHPLFTSAAPVLLQRLKAQFPIAHGSSSHHLFVSVFMLTSKVICNDLYSNKSWSIMEREICGPFDTHEFEAMV